MSDSNNLLLSVFSGATETRNLEFKEGFGWEEENSRKARDEVIKAVLAMSNTPSGGAIILGIRTDTRKKKVYTEGFSKKHTDSYIKNEEQIKTVVHGYCQRPVEIQISSEKHPEDEDKYFVIIQVKEFNRWPTVTLKPSKTKENNSNRPVIENHAVYVRSKLARWASIKAGPQEIEDIVEIAVKRYDSHVRDLGYTRVSTKIKETNEWLITKQQEAHSELNKLEISTYMEVQVKVLDGNTEYDNTILRDAASESTVPTFGWPIGIFLGNREEYRPVPDDNGIKAVIPMERSALEEGKTFDYWAIHTSGSFYLLKSIFEDLRNPEIISFNTRIVRITEVFMYLNNLYSKLDVPKDTSLEVTIKHSGIKDRHLGTLSQNRIMFRTNIASRDAISTTATLNIADFETDPFSVVERYTKPLFEIFNFFKLDRNVLEEVVRSYLAGKVT